MPPDPSAGGISESNSQPSPSQNPQKVPSNAHQGCGLIEQPNETVGVSTAIKNKKYNKKIINAYKG